jgi:hypothetical protein
MPDDRVTIVWNALCPVDWPGCDWRSNNHVSEEHALAVSQAHGDTDTPRHQVVRETAPWRIMPKLASIDFLPPVAASHSL